MPTSSSPEADLTATAEPGRSRRRFLKTGALTALAVAAGVGPVGAAAKKTTKKKTTKKTATATAAPTTAAPAAAPAAKTAASGAAWPSGHQLDVTFTYTPSDSGRAHNPFVAVWFEDANGASIRTIDLEFEAGRGMRWLPELSRWYNADQVRQITGGADLINTISSATRLPGTYTVSWDGKDDNGAAVAQGDYVLCVEAAREHGPYSLVKEQISVNASTSKKLADNGELHAVTVAMKAKK